MGCDFLGCLIRNEAGRDCQQTENDFDAYSVLMYDLSEGNASTNVIEGNRSHSDDGMNGRAIVGNESGHSLQCPSRTVQVSLFVACRSVTCWIGSDENDRTCRLVVRWAEVLKIWRVASVGRYCKRRRGTDEGKENKKESNDKWKKRVEGY